MSRPFTPGSASSADFTRVVTMPSSIPVPTVVAGAASVSGSRLPQPDTATKAAPESTSE
jgi:hypothetical protein